MRRKRYRRRKKGHRPGSVLRRILLLFLGAGLLYPCLPGRRPVTENVSSAEESQTEDGDWIAESVTIAKGEKIYRLSTDYVETETGTYPLAAEVQLYVEGEKSEERAGNYLAGMRAVLTAAEDGRIEAIEVQGLLQMPEVIRVLLSDGERGYQHSSLQIRCDQPFWTSQNGVLQTYPAGSELILDEEETKARLCLYAVSSEARWSVTFSNGVTREYYGGLELVPGTEGLSLINEVALETYLCGVVPAEMPESYGLEAARTQAVCARSYACYQWRYSEKYAEVGAHLEDTVLSQCYIGAATEGVAAEGVRSTWGQVLCYEECIIPATYFSTSCGWTAAAADVWSGEAAEYLTAKAQYTEGEYGNLQEEEAFHAFITDPEVEAFDQNSRWFRWTAVLDVEDLREPLESYLSGVESVKIVEGEYFVEEECSSIGEVVDCYIYSRASSGLATSLLVEGSEATVKIEGAQSIRQLLAGAEVTLSTGDSIGSMAALPSAFISLEKIKDTDGKTVSIRICGGGYGHGSGLSQTGVYGMTELGYTYEEILMHYYEGAILSDWLG